MSELQKALAKRCDGYWEMLATAAGMPASVEKSLQRLSAEELSMGFGHPDCIIMERVEALAAWDPVVLADLSKTWVRPRTDRSLQWTQAWRASLRHLKALNAVAPGEFDVPELADEFDVLWGEVPEGPLSWSAIFEMMKGQPLSHYWLIRRLARSGLVGPYPSLAELLDAPPGMLRLLRGNVSHLTSEARHYLLEAGASCLKGELKRMPTVVQRWVVGPDGKPTRVEGLPAFLPLGQTPLEGNLTDAPPILELCWEISPGFTEALAGKLAERISEISDPRAIATVVFILVSEWRLP
jgi:hypothetical protein